ncbi:mortality factor 4-like protein 1 [Trichonephila clavata]|uniref:Mortality factor 4-like protein 1 n=1 Tax=Trichonephila clavata TaxID=2740835 RepID=A0A8X6KQZ4_TRICU|nr:mortality factor 4-like protein 1 [Trichonephila clavata]
MALRFRFAKGEKVLCFHGPLLRHATCLNRKIQDNRAEYLVHYTGWSARWDEWVFATRVYKYNETNLRKQKKLEKKYKKISKTNRKVGKGCPNAEAVTFALLGTTLKMPRLAALGLQERE